MAAAADNLRNPPHRVVTTVQGCAGIHTEHGLMPNQLCLSRPSYPLGIWSGARTDPLCSASDWGRSFGPRLLPWPFDTPSGKPPEGQEKAWHPSRCFGPRCGSGEGGFLEAEPTFSSSLKGKRGHERHSGGGLGSRSCLQRGVVPPECPGSWMRGLSPCEVSCNGCTGEHDESRCNETCRPGEGDGGEILEGF